MNTSLSGQPRWRRGEAHTAGRRVRLGLAATAATGLALVTAGAATAAATPNAATAAATPNAATAAATPNAATGQGAAAATSSWQIVKSVRGQNFPNFTAVAVTGRHGAWAFESSSSSTGFLKPTAWKLASGQWNRATFPGKRTEVVSAAAATSPSDVWVLANSDSGTRALLFNGSIWSVAHTFKSDFLHSVVPLSRHEAWAFGHTSSPGAWHFHAGQWSLVKSGHGLFAGSALAPGNVWAIGPTSVAHWNGTTWTRTSVKALLPPKGKLNSPRLTSIYAQSRSSVWAVGTAGEESQGGPVVVLHYNGHHWARAALANVCCGFPGQVIADGSGGLWVPYGFMENSYSMLHYTSGHVHKTALPVPSGMTLNLASAAAVPGESRAYAVGGAWPGTGPTFAFTRALILAYGS
jgi:hypothetical protein